MKAITKEWLQAARDDLEVGEFGLLPQGKPTLNEAAEFCDFAKEIYKSINSLLEKQ